MAQVTKPPVFQFLDSINYTKINLIETNQLTEAEYVPWIINKGLSLFKDTIIYANKMNIHGTHLSNRMQYEFYLAAVPRRKRFSKWPKPPVNTETFGIIQRAYKYNNRKTEELIDILSDKELDELLALLQEGGAVTS